MHHVLHIPSWYPDADNRISGNFFRAQVIALKQAGWQVGVIAPNPRSLRDLRHALTEWRYGTVFENDQDVPTYRHYGWAWLPRVPYGNAILWLTAAEQLFQIYIQAHGMPDLIHVHSALYAGTFAARLKQRYAIPYLLSEQSTAFARGLLPPWQIKMARRSYRNASARVVVSPALGQKITEVLGNDAVPDWQWIPNIVDPAFTESAIQESPKKTDDTQLFCYLHIALMTEKKGQCDLLQAFAAQFSDHPNVRLRIGGDGPLRARLEQLARTLGIAHQVTFLGRLSREQVLTEMQHADVFVLPSHYETFGVVVIEALACGKPVVATTCGGPEFILHEKNGRLVPPRDPLALGKALAEVQKHYSSYDQCAIRTECLAHYSGEAIADRFSKLYQQLAFHR